MVFTVWWFGKYNIKYSFLEQCTWPCCCHTNMETNICITHFGSKSIAVVLRQIRQPQVLSRVYGKELTDLHHHHQPVSVKYPKLWGDNSELLHAHFGHVTERSTPQVRRRGYLLALAGLGAVLLFNSSSSCWGCINDVSLGSTGGLFDVEAQLLLLGSCGRHNGSGIPCLLGALCLAILIFAQLVILASGVKGDNIRDDDQMAITLMDFREYQERCVPVCVCVRQCFECPRRVYKCVDTIVFPMVLQYKNISEDSSLLNCPDAFPFCTWVKCELIWRNWLIGEWATQFQASANLPLKAWTCWITDPYWSHWFYNHQVHSQVQLLKWSEI